MSVCPIIDINTRADIANELGSLSKTAKKMEECREDLCYIAAFGLVMGALIVGGSVTLYASGNFNGLQAVLSMAMLMPLGGSFGVAAAVNGGILLHMKYAKLTDDEKKQILKEEVKYLTSMRLREKESGKIKYQDAITQANQLLDDSATQKS